jgi:acyl-CoA synthetase (AMP-forming)/AMP-acid ligase II
MPGVSARLLDEAGAAVKPGETGEIYLKGPNVFAGYWRNEEATRAAFSQGWFRTGDLASVSPDGYYTLCGRRSDLIICAGFNIYPREIEEFLMEQPEVNEAAVAGVQDAIKGEVPVAWIVAGGGFDAAELEARCRRNLASFKVPRAFLRVDALPRNALGKVQKPAETRNTRLVDSVCFRVEDICEPDQISNYGIAPRYGRHGAVDTRMLRQLRWWFGDRGAGLPERRFERRQVRPGADRDGRR